MGRLSKSDRERMIKRRFLRAGGGLFCLLFAAYWILVYFLVSAALVPAFMKRLDAFEEITVQSYAEMVQTTDIERNRYRSLQHTDKWLEQTEMKKLFIQSEDGYRLAAAEFLQAEPEEKGKKKVRLQEKKHKWVLLLHGYTGWKEEMYPFACWYYEHGYQVLVPDLRCQGESQGDFIGMGWTDHEDCLLWLDQILKEDNQARIIVHGQSMGAAAALLLAGEKLLTGHVRAVVSDCAYTDAYSMFGYKCKDWFHLPAFPLVDSACLMLRLRGGYDLKKAAPIEAVKRSRTPILLIHGDQDAMIPVSMARRLYAAAICPRQLLVVKGAGHAQSQDKDPKAYYGAIQTFLEKNGM